MSGSQNKLIAKKIPGLEGIIGKSWILDNKSVLIKKYKELSTGLFCVFTDKKILSIPVDEMESFLESIGAFEALTVYQDHKKKPTVKPEVKKAPAIKPIVFHDDIESRLQEAIRETSATLYTLHNTGNEWKVYVLKSKVLLNAGTLKEILHLLLNEILDKRKINVRCEKFKNQKPYSYGR